MSIAVAVQIVNRTFAEEEGERAGGREILPYEESQKNDRAVY